MMRSSAITIQYTFASIILLSRRIGSGILSKYAAALYSPNVRSADSLTKRQTVIVPKNPMSIRTTLSKHSMYEGALMFAMMIIKTWIFDTIWANMCSGSKSAPTSSTSCSPPLRLFQGHESADPMVRPFSQRQFFGAKLT